MHKILVIEDEEDIRYNIAELLNEEGYQVTTARDGGEGIRMIWQDQPDLVLCDILMPKLDGYTVLNMVNRNPTTGSIPFIFLTAKTQREDLRKGMVLGADDYVPKPFSRQDLLQAIETRLQKGAKLQAYIQQKLATLNSGVEVNWPHHLITPLSAILKYTEFLTTIEDLSLAKSISGRLHDAAMDLMESIQKYLYYAELTQSLSMVNNPFDAEVSNCTDLKFTVFEVCGNLASSFNRTEDIHIDLEKVKLKLPEEKFKRVVSELVQNAFRYSLPGTSVSLRGKNGLNGDYSLTIHDYGRGMNEAEISRLKGDDFVQPPHSPSNMPSGIGLDITRQIITHFQGSISVVSDKINGTTIEIQFPALCIEKEETHV